MKTLRATHEAQSKCAATNRTHISNTHDVWHDLTTELERLPLPRYRRFQRDIMPARRPQNKTSHRFPSQDCLMSLARTAEFPISSYGMIALARRKGCDTSLISFLRLFGLNDVFENGVDFLNRCAEVKLFLREEQESPKELLRNPQE